MKERTNISKLALSFCDKLETWMSACVGGRKPTQYPPESRKRYKTVDISYF